MNGATLTMDSTALRTALAAANVTVLTSSSGTEVSREDPAWQHGAFTKALLDAFNDLAADHGLISPNGLGNHVATRVDSLTDGKRTPGMEIRYDTTVLAAGNVSKRRIGWPECRKDEPGDRLQWTSDREARRHCRLARSAGAEQTNERWLPSGRARSSSQ